MPTTDEFDEHRSTLFGLAYRMLGSVMDAEDILQEAYLRWQNVPKADIRSARAYLITMVTRMCVDQLRLARVQREEYVGAWLPEPLMQSSESDPADVVELNESISTAFLVMLESLAPLDRAVFLLHEVFSYTYAEIAKIVDRTPADCRQIGHRARQRLMQGRPRFEVEPEPVAEIVQQFLQACVDGDTSELLALLAPDVKAMNDSGGKVSAVRNTIVGQDFVARMFLGIFRRWWAHLSFSIQTINGQPAMVGCVNGHPISVTSFEVRNNKIQTIYQVLNPDKLKGLTCIVPSDNPSSDLTSDNYISEDTPESGKVVRWSNKGKNDD
jgi:RNA polymerase sigma-70 factor (ECF subfamily)